MQPTKNCACDILKNEKLQPLPGSGCLYFKVHTLPVADLLLYISVFFAGAGNQTIVLSKMHRSYCANITFANTD